MRSGATAPRRSRTPRSGPGGRCGRGSASSSSALEHDAAGALVWRLDGLSVPRQMGKSSVTGEMCSWRQQSGALFGGPQNVLLVARDVGAAITVQKPHRLRAEADPQYKTSAAGGRLAIEYLVDGSEWLIRSCEGVYSYSASLAIADEAWDLSPAVVDDGLHPTTMQPASSQLWVVSTANPRATSLMIGRRAAALAELDEPRSTLWIEWARRPARTSPTRSSGRVRARAGPRRSAPS